MTYGDCKTFGIKDFRHRVWNKLFPTTKKGWVIIGISFSREKQSEEEQ